MSIVIEPTGRLLAPYPALLWVVWLRWPFAALWLWQGVRVWRNPDLFARALVGERKGARPSFHKP
jgi:hypothetical protein